MAMVGVQQMPGPPHHFIVNAPLSHRAGIGNAHIQHGQSSQVPQAHGHVQVLGPTNFTARHQLQFGTPSHGGSRAATPPHPPYAQPANLASVPVPGQAPAMPKRLPSYTAQFSSSGNLTLGGSATRCQTPSQPLGSRESDVPEPHFGGGLAIEAVDTQPNVRPGFGSESHAELESLKRSLHIQEERVRQLTRELKASRENETKSCAEASVARAELARTTEELRLERLAREQVEAVVAEQQVAADLAGSGDNDRAPRSRRAADAQRGHESHVARQLSTRGRDSGGDARLGENLRMQEHSRDRVGGAREVSQSTGPTKTRSQERFRREQAQAADRATLDKKSMGKDEVDARFNEFLDRADCHLTFRRQNRGWYRFRVAGEREERSVEISITNGKLMAKVEPSTHDPGWNNGKLGPIERFVAHFSSM